MKEIKSAEEILNEVGSTYKYPNGEPCEDWEDAYYTTDTFAQYLELEKKAMQIYASQFIDKAAEVAECRPVGAIGYEVDKDSILDLKNELNETENGNADFNRMG